ncbi:glycoside hydrolase family 35 protein [Xylariaceae sp. AK1471]|nr:glycoside hydrolase family 35 protein [Xylariaceae sp. AK1471]
MKFLGVLAASTLLSIVCAFGVGGKPGAIIKDFAEKRQSAQDIVTWDEHSLFINGERVMIFSGEVHPFRLPVPSLWLDVFQKVKALGFNCVSFYVDWALLEGKPGNFTAEGVFDLRPFFVAAKTAGIYLLARPGPYINAEVSGGGFPGWLSRNRGALRTSSPDFLAATDNYIANIAKIIVDAQITNGGPVILYQPENEYTGANTYTPFPDGAYMAYVEQQARDAGIVVPLISNDASASGHNAPGTGLGEVDIYGHDGYPLGFDCANPTVWPAGRLPTTYRATHLRESPSTPYSIVEFQGGSFDPWGGWGFEMCSQLVNHEFERVFYKNNFAAGVTIYNLYMIFGGTNWGNLGHPGGYTSYDYGSVLKEDRTITREKYSELKLQATFLMSSPSYLTAIPGNSSNATYSDTTDITVTPLLGNTTDDASFFVVRHSEYTSLNSTSYKVTLPTSQGKITVPSGDQSLSLNGRDSKIMVTDYDVQGTRLLYSTADIFTQNKYDERTILIMYAGATEYNEFAIQGSSDDVKELEKGGNFTVVGGNSSDFVTIGWAASPDRTVLQIGGVNVYLLDRNSAYNYWVTSTGNDTTKVIVNGPYLIRSASLSEGELQIQADFNKSTTVEIIGAPSGVSKFVVNGQDTPLQKSNTSMVATITLTDPSANIPSLADLKWKYIDSLPEIQANYDDSAWTVADHTLTNNTYQMLITPVSLYASDYGYNAGILVYRGHFNATGYETALSLWTQGGSGFASAVWLDDKLITSFRGNGSSEYNQDSSIAIPSLEANSAHVFTVLIDQMGHNEEGIGSDQMKSPRGIIGWRFATSKATNTPITWKLTGNLGGEDYRDRARGPLNEGGLFIERQGYHLPSPPSDSWTAGSPLDGIDKAGVAFYSTSFTLDLPSDEWDIPLAFSFANDTATSGTYRAQLYVNGWQFGKLSSTIGPQTVFPVPEGILNYRGENWVGITIWALEDTGAKVPGLELTAGIPVWTGREKVELVDSPAWAEREAAY